MNWLGAVMPFELTPVFLLAIGAIIGTIGAPWVPKRRMSISTEGQSASQLCAGINNAVASV